MNASVSTLLLVAQEASVGDEEDDEEAVAGLSSTGSVAGWLETIKNIAESPKERQHALKSLARFSAVPEDCRAIVKVNCSPPPEVAELSTHACIFSKHCITSLTNTGGSAGCGKAKCCRLCNSSA